jgi:alanine dehydrogenase
MLVLTDEELSEILTPEMAIESLEKTYRTIDDGWSGDGRRCDLITANRQSPDQTPCHGLKTMAGSISDEKVVALRINSDIITWPQTPNGVKRVKVPKAPGNRYTGLVMLFSSETGQLLSMFPDASIQRMRVAATCAIGIKHLARDDAGILGIYGSGWQAGAHVMTAVTVRPIEKIIVYSPNAANREKFCLEMAALTGINATPSAEPAKVAKADIVLACTNSLDPVILGHTVQPGSYLSCVKPGELDKAAYARCDRVVLHSRQSEPIETFLNGGQGDPPGLVKERSSYISRNTGDVNWSELSLIEEIVQGKAPGRQTPDETICFCNNIGRGIQFASVGYALYRKAIQEKRGRDLSSEWFSQLNHP